jgi:hypothetical protein
VTIAFNEALEILSLLFLGKSDTYMYMHDHRRSLESYKGTTDKDEATNKALSLSLYADYVAQTPEP